MLMFGLTAPALVKRPVVNDPQLSEGPFVLLQPAEYHRQEVPATAVQMVPTHRPLTPMSCRYFTSGSRSRLRRMLSRAACVARTP